MSKKWIQAKEYEQEFRDRFQEINRVVLQWLYNRGLTTQEAIDQFLGPDYLRDQHDPFLLVDMKKAVARIFKAIKNQEKIIIHGDYDADGVTSTATLILTLKRLGAKRLGVYIPNRITEGYGMNKKTIENLAKDKVDLIITVDCGISNWAETDLARELGIEVIVTDHHAEPEKLPNAPIIICPTLKREKYPFRELAGVGVAFKLAQALLRFDKTKNNDAFEKWLLDLVAIGTVADCMPLLKENRTLVKWGLLVLNKTQRLGLKELIENTVIGNEIGTYNINFQIAPRLNAAGRMDHANTAYELLVTDDEMEAIAIASDLNQKNQARQKVTEEMIQISLGQIGEPKVEDKILFSANDGWSPGLVGLAAGKLADKFSRPVIVFGQNGKKYVASGRSIPEFDITAALRECREFLADFGGHSQACGLTINGEENFLKFKEKMKIIANEKLRGVELLPHLDIEAEVKLHEINWELIDELNKFAPFGEGNKKPLLVTKNLTVQEIATMGNNSQHLKLILKQGDSAKKFVGFNLAAEWGSKIKVGDKIDVVYELGVNEWNGNREIQCRVEDIRETEKF